MVTRRAMLAGALAVPFLPTAADAQATADMQVTGALDVAASLPPEQALAHLAAIDAAVLPPGARLDMEAARAGLAIDRDLARFGGNAKGGWRPDPGSMARLPDGAAWYALLLQRGLGTTDLHTARDRLAREHASLDARAARLFARVGLTRGGIGERYRALWRDPRFLYADDAQGRADAVAAMARDLAAARPRVTQQLGPVPAWTLACAVRALSPEEIAAGRNGYRTVPTPTTPGAYIVDLKQVRRRPSWTLPGVVAHELLPGHMVQLGMEGAAAPHPLRLTYAAAFVEGWGVHAETLAAYPDVRAQLGHLHWLLFRVARARVDMGVHLDGWSADEARARLTEWLGEPAYFAPFDLELQRIPREPASRAAEALAWLAIADGARGRRGAALRAYHHRLLSYGRRRSEQLRLV